MKNGEKTRIAMPTERVVGFCRHNHVRSLALFGSVLRADFGPESDVDVLVEFQSGQEPGLLGLARMEPELSEIVGRRVDLRTPEDLSHLFRNEVVSQAEVQYAE